MKQKLGKLLLVAGLMMTMAGCSNSAYDQEAVDVLLTSTNQMSDMDSFHLKMDMSIKGTIEQEDLNVKATADTDIMKLENDIQGAMNLDLMMNDFPLGNNFNLYLQDSVLYMDMMGQHQKITSPIPLNDFFEMMEPAQTMSEESLKETYKEIKWQDKEKGIIEVTFDDTALASQLKQQQTSTEVEIVTFNGTYTITDSRVSQMTFLMEMKDGEEMMNLDITLEFSKINEITSIEFPDFSDYLEMNLGDEESFGDINQEKSKPNSELESIGGEKL